MTNFSFVATSSGSIDPSVLKGASFFGGMGFGIIFAIIVLIVIVSILKGIALWKAARNNDLGWFVCLLIINTAGILELIYILTHRSPKSSDTPKQINPLAPSSFTPPPFPPQN